MGVGGSFPTSQVAGASGWPLTSLGYWRWGLVDYTWTPKYAFMILVIHYSSCNAHRHISSLWGSYELPDEGVGTPKHVEAFDWTSQESGHLMHLLVFYKGIRICAFLTWGWTALFLCSDVWRLMASNDRMACELMVKYVIGIGRGLTGWYVKKAKSPDNWIFLWFSSR
jgi:hypothetical protein